MSGRYSGLGGAQSSVVPWHIQRASQLKTFESKIELNRKPLHQLGAPMSRFLVCVLLVAMTALGAQNPAASVPPSQPTQVTFTKDVLPILRNNCQTCHRPGEVAPMSFLTCESDQNCPTRCEMSGCSAHKRLSSGDCVRQAISKSMTFPSFQRRGGRAAAGVVSKKSRSLLICPRSAPYIV